MLNTTIKNTMRKFAPRWTERHVNIYGFVLFALGILYMMFALLLLVCYLPFWGVLARGAIMAWLGFALSEKDENLDSPVPSTKRTIDL